MAQKLIGANFFNELRGSVPAIADWRFTWLEDGTLEFDPNVPPAEIAKVQAVYAAHDPTKPDPNAAAAALLVGGLAVTSASMPALNATYGTSAQDEINLTGMQGAVAANVFPGYYRDLNGVRRTMSAAQMTALAEAALAFIVAVEDAKDEALAGGAWVAPGAIAQIP